MMSRAFLTRALTIFVGAVSLLAVAPAARAQGVVLDGAMPQPLPLFPADNWWNIDISQAPLDPNSANFINLIGGAARRIHADWGGSAGDAGRPGRDLRDALHRGARLAAAGAGDLRRVSGPERRRRARPAGRLPDPGPGQVHPRLDRGRSARQHRSRRRSPHADRRPRQPDRLRALPRPLERRAEPLGGRLGRRLPADQQPAPARGLDQRRRLRDGHPARPGALRRGVRHRAHPPRLPGHRAVHQRLRLPRLASRRQHRRVAADGRPSAAARPTSTSPASRPPCSGCCRR